MAMWTLLGARGVDVLHWESFGSGWKTDIEKHLKLEDVRYFGADYGQLPDLSLIDTKRETLYSLGMARHLAYAFLMANGYPITERG